MGRKVALRNALTSSICFFRGAALAEPHRVLEGSGKAMRHIKLRGPKDADRPALNMLIRQAYKVGGADRPGR